VSGVLDELRAELDAVGLTRFDIQLPGEDSAIAPLEGALRVRADGMRFVLETVDYGEAFRLLNADSEAEIKHAAIGYVSRPLPPIRPMSRHELDTIVGKVALHYFDLRDRAREAGPRGIVIDLPQSCRSTESERSTVCIPTRSTRLLSSAHCRQPHCAPRTTFTSS
jgi:hypothetical protein